MIDWVKKTSLDLLVKKNQRQGILSSLTHEKKSLKKKQQHLQDLGEAQTIIHEVAETIQQSAHNQISSIVTKCLIEVFGMDAYEFKIEFIKRSTKTEAKIVLSRDGEEYDYKREVGGGVLDVISFALRISAIMMTRPKVNKVIILDEPFKNLRGQQHRSRIKNLVQQLADELDIQFIINIDTDIYP